ncbi:MAG: hypothetical protein ACRDQE_15565 [Gaiellales bacterium]
MSEIDTEITELLECARLTPPDAAGDWLDVLARSRRAGPRFRVPVRGLLLAAVLLVGVGAVAQAETGVFSFSSDRSSTNGHSQRRLTVHQRRLFRITEATYGGIIGTLPRHQVTGISTVNITTAARMAAVFGGRAARYPERAGVVLVKGPFSISLYLQGCKVIPAACPAPIGRWDWFAYAVLPSPKTGPRSGLPNVRRLGSGHAGQPLPDLHSLGTVTVQTYIPSGSPKTLAHQLQGAITIVSQRRSGLSLARVRCVYAHGGYTEHACQALAEYVAFLHKPRPNETHPSHGAWTRVSGVIGGWRGNLIITRERLAGAPPALRNRIVAGLAAVPTWTITRIPPPLRCVKRPDLCVPRPVAADIDQVIAVANRHGMDAHVIPVSQIPAHYLAAIPPSIAATGAATNAGLPSVARRGYVFSMTFDHPLPFNPTYERFRRLLGKDWGVFPDVNVLTLYHPFTPERGMHYRHNITAFSLLRDLDRLTETP